MSDKIIEMNCRHEEWGAISRLDVSSLIEAEKYYGDSWKRRGGVDSFMMLARKWDRIEHQVEKYNFNILKAGEEDVRPEGILDDIRDLRRYLMLVEQEILTRQKIAEPTSGYVLQD